MMSEFQRYAIHPRWGVRVPVKIRKILGDGRIAVEVNRRTDGPIAKGSRFVINNEDLI